MILCRFSFDIPAADVGFGRTFSFFLHVLERASPDLLPGFQ